MNNTEKRELVKILLEEAQVVRNTLEKKIKDARKRVVNKIKQSSDYKAVMRLFKMSVELNKKANRIAHKSFTTSNYGLSELPSYSSYEYEGKLVDSLMEKETGQAKCALGRLSVIERNLRIETWASGTDAQSIMKKFRKEFSNLIK